MFVFFQYVKRNRFNREKKTKQLKSHQVRECGNALSFQPKMVITSAIKDKRQNNNLQPRRSIFLLKDMANTKRSFAYSENKREANISTTQQRIKSTGISFFWLERSEYISHAGRVSQKKITMTTSASFLFLCSHNFLGEYSSYSAHYIESGCIVPDKRTRGKEEKKKRENQTGIFFFFLPVELRTNYARVPHTSPLLCIYL